MSYHRGKKFSDYIPSPRKPPKPLPKPPKPLPKPPPPPPPPLTGCEFISVGTFGGQNAYIIYDPLNNSATSVLLKSMLDMNTMLANAVINTAPHYVTGNIHGFNGTCSKWGNIVTGFLNLTSAGGGNFHRYMYVKLTVDTAIPDIFFDSYYLPDISNTSAFKHCTPIGGCSVSATVDIWDCDASTPGVVPGIYEITYSQATSTWTDQLLFSLGTGISVQGDMVYRPSDNTIFIVCFNSGTGHSGIRHYTYNGILLNEVWGTVMQNLGGYTMYCYDGEIYFLTTIGEIYRVDADGVNPFAVVLVANPPTFQFAPNDTTGGDGATDSACCNPTTTPPNPCLDPTSPFGQMPYGYKVGWPHWYWYEYTPPLTHTGAQWSWLNTTWTTNSITIPPWVNYPLMEFAQPTSSITTFSGGETASGIPRLPITYNVQNGTANLDYPNQSTFCEYCRDWAFAGNVTGTGQWIGTPNTWGVDNQGNINQAAWGAYLSSVNTSGQTGLEWLDAQRQPVRVNQTGGLTYSTQRPYFQLVDAEAGCECCPKDAQGNYTSVGLIPNSSTPLDPGPLYHPIPPTGTWFGPP